MYLQGYYMLVVIHIPEMTEARLRLAQVQIRLGRHQEAWLILTQALSWLQSPFMAHPLASHPLRER